MEALAGATAKDLMQTDVVRLEADDRVESAVALFEEYHIGGAPVVDAAGQLLGFLSAADVARSEHVQRGEIVTGRGEYSAGTGEVEDDGGFYSKDDYSPEVLGNELVKDWMNPDVISLPPTATLKEICEVMVRESIHRIVVVENGSLRGIVTTFDITRHLAEAL